MKGGPWAKEPIPRGPMLIPQVGKLVSISQVHLWEPFPRQGTPPIQRGWVVKVSCAMDSPCHGGTLTIGCPWSNPYPLGCTLGSPWKDEHIPMPKSSPPAGHLAPKGWESTPGACQRWGTLGSLFLKAPWGLPPRGILMISKKDLKK